MSEAVFPTKGNLMASKRSLQLAKLGYDLMDRKRNILIREMMEMIDTANTIQEKIDNTYDDAYKALQMANISLGLAGDIANAVPVETGLDIVFRSVMGVEIPIVKLEETKPDIHYGFATSNSMLDDAYVLFWHVKKLTSVLAEVENSVYRLAFAIKKTQKRANALKNIIIPRFENNIKFITDALEEKDREEFSRLKVIKQQKQKAQ